MEHHNPEQRSDGPEAEGQRVALILAKARRDVAVRDLITFIAARAWTAVSSLGSILAALVGDRGSTSPRDPNHLNEEDK